METSEFYFIYSVINKFLIFAIPVLRFYKKPAVLGFEPKPKVKSWIDYFTNPRNHSTKLHMTSIMKI